MVLGRGGADAGVAEFLQAIVDRQDGHGGNLRIRREKGMGIHDRAQWNVSKIGGGVMIANHAVGQHRKRGWASETEPAVPLDPNAAAAVGVIHESQFALVGMGLFQRGKFPWFRPERCVLSEQRGQQREQSG